jgi:hypothetical protein
MVARSRIKTPPSGNPSRSPQKNTTARHAPAGRSWGTKSLVGALWTKTRADTSAFANQGDRAAQRNARANRPPNTGCAPANLRRAHASDLPSPVLHPEPTGPENRRERLGLGYCLDRNAAANPRTIPEGSSPTAASRFQATAPRAHGLTASDRARDQEGELGALGAARCLWRRSVRR